MNLSTIDIFENRAIDLVAKFTPWCAPIPTAYLVGRATITLLEWPLPIGILSAAVIESLGLVTCTTALDLYQFNQNRRKNDAPAPFWLAVLLIILYFLIAVLLTVVLEIQPSWSVIAPAIFPVLSLAGVTVIALRNNYQNRIQLITNEKAERKAERKANHTNQRQDLRPLVDATMSNEMSNNGHYDMNLNRLQEGRKAKLNGRLDRLLNAFRLDPMLSISDAARGLDVSRQTVYSYLNQLERSGKIRRNGHGIEVLNE